jgi:hypothetical protein
VLHNYTTSIPRPRMSEGNLIVSIQLLRLVVRRGFHPFDTSVTASRVFLHVKYHIPDITTSLYMWNNFVFSMIQHAILITLQ